MKRISIYIFLFLAMSLISTSCNDALNVDSTSSYTDDAVFNSSEPGMLTAFVNNIYQGIPDGYNWGMLSSVTDESHMNAGSWAGMTDIMKGLLSPSNLSTFDSGSYYGLFNWSNIYKKVRAVNLFFSKIDASPVNAATKSELKGEVFFLRAFLYHNLVAMYGGVPIITKAYNLSDDFSVSRNSYAECVQFISDQCDSAANHLPLVQSEVGRATKGAALTLKSRTLLYAASDLYNTPSNWSSFNHPELVGYTTATAAERQARWQKAKDAAKAVINLGQYSLYKPNPASLTEASTNYYSLFLSMSTSEDIFSRYYSTKISGDWTTCAPQTFHSPSGYHGWGTETPTQQMVDEYEMADGSAFSWSNPTEAAAPYQNRDARFYATILYDGAPWRTRPSDVSGDPVGKIQTGHYYYNASTIKDGLDTDGSNGGVDTWNATWTGYYLKKGVDITLDPASGAAHQTTPWRFMRYSEVLLNYAEACIGLAQLGVNTAANEAEALTYINQIRARAYMPAISTSGSALVQSLRHERKIELAFEELRYFDIRRWMICTQAHANVKGIHILYGSPSNPSSTYGTGVPAYTVKDVDTRSWNSKCYFLPISKDEMDKNTKLIQNPGY